MHLFYLRLSYQWQRNSARNETGHVGPWPYDRDLVEVVPKKSMSPDPRVRLWERWNSQGKVFFTETPGRVFCSMRWPLKASNLRESSCPINGLRVHQSKPTFLWCFWNKHTKLACFFPVALDDYYHHRLLCYRFCYSRIWTWAITVQEDKLLTIWFVCHMSELARLFFVMNRHNTEPVICLYAAQKT